MTTKAGSTKVQGADTQTTKPGHAEVSGTEKLAATTTGNLLDGKGTENKELIPFKRKMTVSDKIAAMDVFDALASKLDYLKGVKLKLEKFAQGTSGWQGARLILTTNDGDQIQVNNPGIVQELIDISKMRVTEATTATEKEIEAFEII